MREVGFEPHHRDASAMDRSPPGGEEIHEAEPPTGDGGGLGANHVPGLLILTLRRRAGRVRDLHTETAVSVRSADPDPRAGDARMADRIRDQLAREQDRILALLALQGQERRDDSPDRTGSLVVGGEGQVQLEVEPPLAVGDPGARIDAP